MANLMDHSVPEAGSSSGPARNTRSRARQYVQEESRETDTGALRTAHAGQTERRSRSRARLEQSERASQCEADTLARRTARARRSQGETVNTREADTLARRTARARRSQGETVNTREANTLARSTARASQAQQQASTPEWSRLPVLNRPNPAAIHLGHEHQCSHCNARLLSEENESFCCREGKVAITPLHSLPEGWEQMFRMPTFRYGSLCMSAL